jgi:hypothetical protein
MSEFSLAALLLPGGHGTTELDLRLSAREVAAVQLVLGVVSDNGIFEGACFLAAAQHGVAEQWGVAFQSAQLRIGAAIALLQPAIDHGELS